MLNIIQHIKKVELIFDNEKIIPELPLLHPDNQPLTFGVPLDLDFNQSWEVHHNCSCGQTVSFSHANNWNPISRLFTRFYSRKVLKTIAKGFDSIKVFKTPNSEYTFLTDATFNDRQANILQIPQIRFNFYQCEHCCNEYLCQIHEGAPASPSRDYHDGFNGFLSISEIVQIEWKGEGTLLDYLEGEYTEPEL